MAQDSERRMGQWVRGAVAVGGTLTALGTLARYTDVFRRRKTPMERAAEVLLSPPVLLGAGALLGFGIFRWQLARLFSEQPDYEVERRIGNLEIRRYAPQVVAETKVHAASFREGLNKGFRLLAGYIFGKNMDSTRIAMTAPVSQEHEGTKISMTAPVSFAPSSLAGESGWVMRFVMPKKWTLGSLPAPLDERVHLRQLPERRVAALRWSGTFDADKNARMQEELLTRLRAEGLRPEGEPLFAGYDAPSTLPFLRRNEAWVELAP